MADDRHPEITTLLEEIRAGNAQAKNQLVDLVYEHLRQQALGLMRRERAGHTLQATALVHEVLLRLLSPKALGQTQNRAHLFAAAARAMRRILVDHARRRATGTRGGGEECVALDERLD